MRMNLELKPKMINTFKKIIQQMRKALISQQNVYMIVSTQYITFITEYDSKNLRNCNIKIQMGTEYFTLGSSILDSKQEYHQITFKILDFNQFAQNINGLQDTNCTVNLFLSKEGESRYIKVKCTESDSLVTQSRSEIKLFFNQLAFPEVDQKIFGMNIRSKDLSKLLEISNSNQCDLEMSFNIRSEGNQGMGTIYFKLKSPSIKIVYDDVKVFDVGDQSQRPEGSSSAQVAVDVDKKCVQNILFKISQIHAKQLSHICQLDEQMSICILQDGSLEIAFWEAAGPEIENTIIAMKHFIVPKIEDYDNQEFVRMEMEDENNEESDSVVKIEERKKKQTMYSSDSEDNDD